MTGQQPQSGRSAERAALADAIARYQKATAYLDKVEMAIAQRSNLNLSLWVDIERAEADVEEAKKHEPKRLVAALVTDGAEPEPDDSPSLEKAEAALAALQQRKAQNRADLDLLENERRDAATACSFAISSRNDAIKGVVCSDESVGRMLAAYQAAQLRTWALLNALHEVAFAMPKDFQGHPKIEQAVKSEEIDLSMRDQWRDALLALETDPDAALPEIA